MEYDKDEMNEWKELDGWTSDGVMSMLEEGQKTETYNHNEYIGMVGIKIQNESWLDETIKSTFGIQLKAVKNNIGWVWSE